MNSGLNGDKVNGSATLDSGFSYTMSWEPTPVKTVACNKTRFGGTDKDGILTGGLYWCPENLNF
jgi:hypothetical protein